MSIAHLYCGYKQHPGGYRYIATRYEECQVILVQDGVLWIDSDKQVTAVRPGMLCVLAVGSAFTLYCTESVGYRGIFATMLPPDLLACYRGNPCVLPADTATLSLARLIADEYTIPWEMSNDDIKYLGMLFLHAGIRAAKAQHEQSTSTAAYWVEYACSHIDKHIYTNQEMVSCLAALPMSYRQLGRLFHQVLGISPKQYQMRRRIEEACRLLTGTTTPIVQIALDLGFSSAQHFSTQFRQLVGCSPTVFREQAPVTPGSV